MDLTIRQSAEHYLKLARQSAKANNSLGARMAYFMSIQAWKKAIEEHPSLSTNLAAVQREYLHFIRSDARYREVLSQIREIIARKPGIQEAELFAKLSKHPETDLKYTLYFAVRDGQIWSVKKEGGCELHLPSGQQKFTFKSLIKLLRGKISTN
ncbi:MAG: hypothetical protein HY033_06620 [Ignavibacteriae bacterium]|nr:hypothetical protein [Ignavibacteria bacterium]MBI3364565.1 hypothetical protein [Ignavibacteriota bacterium]